MAIPMVHTSAASRCTKPKLWLHAGNQWPKMVYDADLRLLANAGFFDRRHGISRVYFTIGTGSGRPCGGPCAALAHCAFRSRPQDICAASPGPCASSGTEAIGCLSIYEPRLGPGVEAPGRSRGEMDY